MITIDREAAWNWIVGYYGRPGVADELLREQQETDLDVVLHLFEQYLCEVRGIRLDAGALAQAQAGISTWRSQVIKPIRNLRRELKTMSGLDTIDPSRHGFRESIKGMEVMAERVEFLSLCNWLETWIEVHGS